MKGLLLATLILAGTTTAKVADVLKTPAKYDGKAIVVKGKVDRFKLKTSKAGHDYTTFDLVDGKTKLAVYLGNKLDKPVKDGDAVTVTGKFAASRKVGDRTFTNEIDASSRLDKSFGVKAGK